MNFHRRIRIVSNQATVADACYAALPYLESLCEDYVTETASFDMGVHDDPRPSVCAERELRAALYSALPAEEREKLDRSAWVDWPDYGIRLHVCQLNQGREMQT